MANNAYDTSGELVSNQLQEILAGQRLQARQAQQDALNKQNVQSEIAYRDANSKSLTEDRASKEADRKAQEIQRRASLYSPNQAMSPEDLAYFQQSGAGSLINPAQPAQPQFDYEGQADTPTIGPTFHGLPAQLETLRKNKVQEDAMKQFLGPEFDKLDDLHKEAIYRAAYNTNAPESVIRPKTGGKVYFADEGSKSLIDSVTHKPVSINQLGPNDKVVNIPRPPQPNATTVGKTENFDVPDPKDPTKTIRETHYVLPNERPDFGPNSKTRIIGGVRVTNTPEKPGTVKPLYDKTAFNNYRASLGNLTKENQARANLINSITDSQVKDDVYKITEIKELKDMDLNMLVSQGVLHGTPEHIEKVKEVIKAIRGF